MAPIKKMIFRGDVNRIYDDKYRKEEAAKKEKFFIRPSRKRKLKNAKWFSVGMGIDLPFCLIILILLVVGTIMMFSASYAFSYYTNEQAPQNRPDRSGNRVFRSGAGADSALGKRRS